jgi:signal transduction histidine kinase
MNLRALASLVIVALSALAVSAAAALAVVTSRLSASVASQSDAVESVRVVQEVQVELLVLHREINRLPPTDRSPETIDRLRSDMERHVAQLHVFVGSVEEARLVADVQERVERYLDVQHLAGDGGLPVPGSLAARERLDSAFNMLEQLVELNVQESRAERAAAIEWDRIADVAGATLAVGLAGATLALLVWVWGFAMRPLFRLRGALERFAAGDRAARAPETGPREMRDIARRFNEMASALARERRNELTFLSAVAHDLRNPLQVLHVSAALAAHDEQPIGPEQLRKALGVVGRQVARLDRMVGDLLDAARIEAGELDLTPESVAARAIARSVAELYELGAERTLTVRLPCDAVAIWCDPMRVEQVLHNLVSNALKYSPAASPIELAVERGNGHVVLSVIDRGIGIAPEDQGRIFEPFRRTSAARSASGGIGLGLSVSRRIVEAHGGHIEVDSTPGEGSTFRVCLPLASARPAKEAPPAGPLPAHPAPPSMPPP